MTDAARNLDGVAARVVRARGDVVALDLSADDLQPLIAHVRAEVDAKDDGIYVDRYRVRTVLGAACTTAARAVDQIVAALQLPYPATRGWEDMLSHLSGGYADRREYVFVADAADLLRHEETDLWHRLVAEMKSGPHCLGGGYTTVILVDDEYSWSRSRFGSAAATGKAAVDAWRHAARHRHVVADPDGDDY